jgi:hypothetical protein
VLRYPDQPAQEELSPEESDEMKQASFELTQDDIDDAHAFVLRTAHQLIKVARADSDLDDLIGAVQNGRSQELNLLVDHGLTPDTIFDAVKGASYPIEPGKSAVAYSLLAKSARLGPLAMGLAQAEILELAQHHALAGYKAAADPEAGVYKTSCLAKIFSEFERGARLEEARDYFFSKDAALIDEAVQAEQDTPPLTEEQLLALLMQQQQQPQQLLAPAQENPELNEDGPGGQDIATEEALTPTMV